MSVLTFSALTRPAEASVARRTRRSSQKGNFLGPAAKEGIAILFPDTSPRGAGIEGETDSWDFGVGACYPTQISHGNTGHTQVPQAPASMWTRRTRSMQSITTC